MNQKQREYTVTQIQKNNEESKSLRNSAARNAFMLGLVTISTVLSFGNYFQQVDLSIAEKIHQLAFTTAQAGLGIYWLTNMVGKLSKKAGVEVMTENLEYNLKMDDLEKGGKAR